MSNLGHSRFVFPFFKGCLPPKTTIKMAIIMLSTPFNTYVCYIWMAFYVFSAGISVRRNGH